MWWCTWIETGRTAPPSLGTRPLPGRLRYHRAGALEEHPLAGSEILDVPFVHSVFHPSDFSPESANAFAHALAIALIRRTEFAILHSARDHLAED